MAKLLVLVFFLLGLLSNTHAHECRSADLNGDGKVNIADFLIFVDQFGGVPAVECPPSTAAVRDTIYVPVDRVAAGEDLSVPAGLASLYVSVRKIPTGLTIKIGYRDFFGNTLWDTLETWKSPDGLIISIEKDGDKVYTTSSAIFQPDRNNAASTQNGLQAAIPKSKIPSIHDDWSYHYHVRVVVVFGSSEYSNY